jgi:hypothetical protein
MPPASRTPEPAKGVNPVLIGIIIVAVIGVGLLAFWRNGDPAATTSTAASSTTEPQSGPVTPPVTADIEARTEVVAKMGPHKQSSLPPIPFQGYAPPRAPEVVAAAFQFAAEHPEVLSYVPCFCGCEQGGHKGNHDCFVRSRAANGDVLEWEEHGVECAVCIDVATRARQMYSSGASVTDIRAAIEKEYVPNAQRMTPTPKPHAAHSTH